MASLSLATDLASWASQFDVKNNAVDHLLKILQKHGHTNLPSSAHTLLKTPRKISTIQKCGMEYLHYPLRKQLLDKLEKYPVEEILGHDTINLSFNVDGLPLFKSSDNFAKALKWCKAAEYHSAVESEVDNYAKRPTKKPVRYDDSSDETLEVLLRKVVYHFRSNEVGSSPRMELEGFLRSINFLWAFHTGRGMRGACRWKYLREQRPDIRHYFDTWHVSKDYVDTLLKILFEDVVPNPGPYQEQMSELKVPENLCAAFARPDLQEPVGPAFHSLLWLFQMNM
ncbi:unnamed protein product [Leuciscus chuanchicus]